MKPETWVEHQLAALHVRIAPLRAAAGDPRVQAAALALALLAIVWRLVSVARSKSLADDAERRQKAQREAAKAGWMLISW
jgi:hypothetical protein